jgi:hypothetical protein
VEAGGNGVHARIVATLGIAVVRGLLRGATCFAPGACSGRSLHAARPSAFRHGRTDLAQLFRAGRPPTCGIVIRMGNNSSFDLDGAQSAPTKVSAVVGA